MKKFSILESKHAIQCWRYEVEAESQEEAIEKIRNGEVDSDDYWVDDDPFESFEYEVESEEEVEPEFDSAGFSIADREEDPEQSHHCDDLDCNCM